MKRVKAKGAVNGVPRGRVPRAEREAQLLDVSEALFAEHGYQGTAIEDIASAAGVTRPMIYNYFQSKDGIYLACLQRARAALQGKLVAVVAAAQTSSREQTLRHALDSYFEFLQERPGAWELLYGGGIAVAGPAADEARSLRFKTVDVIAALLKTQIIGTDGSQPIDELKILQIAHFLSGGCEQLAKWWRLNPDIARESVTSTAFDFCWPSLGSYSRN